MAETESKTASSVPGSADPSPFPLPRVTIRFCTQCKWMLRAAYFAQELLSTFSTSLGEVALQPSTGGTFIVEIFFRDPNTSSSNPTIQNRILWDRKTDGGFPETKELKRRVRDAIEPGRDLGHVDKQYPASGSKAATTMATTKPGEGQTEREEAVGALNPKPETIGGPVCGKPGSESTLVNAATMEECEDCK
ncbi:Rdx family-domain-containing protein [Hypoxylon sp. FL1150]|nr:Rdx family-domain-containing protein [Hypoxylon sp. FL1150]